MLYLLDTNTISDLITFQSEVSRHAARRLLEGDSLGLCHPVHYEILRGLYWRQANVKLQVYLQRIVPIMQWVNLTDADWERAAYFWSDARKKGKQLGDSDLFLAALTHRIGATLVSSDTDFDVFPITRQNWRLQE